MKPPTEVAGSLLTYIEVDVYVKYTLGAMNKSTVVSSGDATAHGSSGMGEWRGEAGGMENEQMDALQ